MTTTVAIINWNSGHWLRRCVESLLATSTRAEILIIDNASDDASLESVIGFRNKVGIVQNSVNRGFASAVNQAFQETSSTYILVLNPDIRVLPGSVVILEDFMNMHPRAGAVGGYVNDKYLPRDLPTIGALVRENLGFGHRKLKSKEEQAVRVDQPAAAALMIRREAYEDVGGFDERFFPAWYEDVDFCSRLKTAGWEVYFAPKAQFLHEGGYSAEALGTSTFANAYYTNQLRYVKKHLGAPASVIVRASIAAGMIGRMIGRPKNAAAYARAFIGAMGRW